MTPVFEQDLSSLFDALLIQPPGCYVLQQGDVGNDLLSAVVLANHRHLCHLLCTEQNYPRFVQY